MALFYLNVPNGIGYKYNKKYGLKYHAYDREEIKPDCR